MSEYLPALVTLLTSGGLLGGVYMLLKLRPEAGQIIVTQAEGAVIVQGKVIDDLQEQNAELKVDNKSLRARVTSLEAKNRELEGENRGLKHRVESLETKVDLLEKRVEG
jgi:FtsZ-binding cell division protein ZapB